MGLSDSINHISFTKISYLLYSRTRIFKDIIMPNMSFYVLFAINILLLTVNRYLKYHKIQYD
jgi:hypothetical protein